MDNQRPPVLPTRYIHMYIIANNGTSSVMEIGVPELMTGLATFVSIRVQLAVCVCGCVGYTSVDMCVL